MGKWIGVVATIVIAIVAATSATFAVVNTADVDSSVNLENPAAPNNMMSSGEGGGSGAVRYGTTP